jgi:hypothetical protein
MKGFTTTFTTCKNMWSQVSVAMSMMLMAFLFSANTYGQATLTSDMPDYAPGSTATLTGNGFLPLEIVKMQVLHADGTPSTGADHDPWNVTADLNGHFVTTWHVCEDDCLGSLLRATADGLISLRHAEALFTDNFSIDFSQAANKDNPLPLGTFHWIGSILQSSNSRIVEGMSTIQRVIVTDLTGGLVLPAGGGTVHRLRIFLSASKSGFHSYDFITGWNQALGATESVAPGFGLYPPSQSVANNGSCTAGTGPYGTYQLCNGSSVYNTNINVCGDAIGAVAGTACVDLHSDQGRFRDLPIAVLETDLPRAGDDPGATVPTRAANYVTRYGPRTVRVWVLKTGAPGDAGFSGTNGDVNNRVEFVGYSIPTTASDVDIFYDIVWNSTSPSVAIEFGAHVAVGTDGLDANVTTNVGYGAGRGASNISGGPYHVKMDDWVAPPDLQGGVWTDEGNIGNLDNQLQGADILVIPTCNITGTPQTDLCPNAADFILNAHPQNLDAPVFAWSFLHNHTGATFTSVTNDSVVTINPGSTPGCDTVRFIVTNAGGLADTCETHYCVACPTPTIGSPGANTTLECPATPSFTAPTATDACGTVTVINLGDVTSGTACNKTTTRTWRAVNSCGNSSGTVAQSITVRDITAPTIGNPGANTTLECPATPSFTPPTATDACNTVTVINLGDVTSGTACNLTTTRTWRAVDACNNSSGTVAQSITVRDLTAPTIGSPGANTTIDCPATPSFTPPTATDACNTVTVINLGDVTSGTACNKTTTRTWRAVDACNNSSGTVAQSITVRDLTAPTIGNPGANTTLECPATPSFTAPTATDACNTVTVINLGDVTSGTACNLTTTRTWRAVDACNNSSGTVAQSITVRDITAPTIGNPGANTTLECPATPSFTAPTATDACNTVTVINLGDVTSGTACNKTTTRTWRAVDACNNSSGTVAQSITVRDITAPTIGNPGANTTLECPATPSFTAPTATDACNTVTVINLGDVTSGTACNLTTTRTWRAVDACNNSSGTVAQSITVRDITAPTIGNPGANTTLECPATPSFTAPTATDACNTVTVINLGDVTSGTACNLTTTRTWRAVDACNNSSGTVAQSITVRDLTAPTIGNPGANTTLECPATPSFTAPTATDACNTVTVINLGDVTSGTACNLTTTRTWRAVDACNNSSGTVAQSITVRDITAPTIGNPGANTTLECPATPSFTAPTATDACNTVTVINLGDVTSGTACNKTTTRTWRAVDACNNSSGTVAQSITVRDITAPTIGNPGANTTLECPATPSFTAPTATDACNTVTVINLGDVTSGTACNLTTTRTWRAVDACNNSSGTVAQSITVRDLTAPTIGNPGANTTLECPATPSFTAPTATDACNTVTVINLGDVTSGTACNKTTTRTWRAVDACNNSSGTVAQSITVRDITAPTIGNPGANTTLECPATPSFTAPTATDACSTVTVINLGDVTSGTACNKTTTRTWRAVDACNNSSGTVAQSITVRDITAPTLGSPGANTTIDCPATPSFTAPTATDACSTVTVIQLVPDVTVQGSVAGSYTVTRTWRAVDACGNSSATRSQSVFVRCNQGACTYTQGYYGTGPNPSQCNGVTVIGGGGLGLIQSLLANGGDLIIGRPGFEVIIPNSLAGATKLNQVMPGGQAPTWLNAGNCNILNACFDAYLTKQGRINNVLLSQTIALALNLRMPGTPLGSFPIQNGWLATQTKSGCGQGSTILSCANGGTITSFHMDSSVANYLTNFGNNTATVNDLLALANDVLGHVLTPGTAGAHGNTVPTFGAIESAVALFNEAFDECRQFLGYYNCAVTCANIGLINPCSGGTPGRMPTTELTEQLQGQTMKVDAYPNPYNDNVRFVIQSTMTGQGVLEVYNTLGQKIQVVYQGMIFAGMGQTIEYKVPAFNRTNLIYILRVGDKQVTGKLLHLE